MIDLDALQADAESDGRRCVVGALVRDERGRVFVHRRGHHRAFLPGCWDIPGGHVEPGEPLRAALERELAEETGWSLVGEPQLVFVADWEAGSAGAVVPRREFDFLVEVEGDLTRPRLEHPAHIEHAWVAADMLELLDEHRPADDGLLRRVVRSALYWPRSDRPAYPHVTVFLDGPAATEVEGLRRRFDPVMADGVAAHVTVAYPREIPDLDEMLRRTRHAAERSAAFRVTLGPVRRDRDHGTVLVAVEDVDGGLARLRERIVGSDGRSGAWQPHVTLVHPRTTNRGTAAWRELRGRSLRGDCHVGAVHVTALRGTRWQTEDVSTLRWTRWQTEDVSTLRGPDG